jgi:cytochrome b subunit of formate dehydrogenase
VVFLAVIIHDLAALFGVAGVLSHVYLGTAANPGTLQAIFTGWVTKGWARLHHPIWYEKITGRPAADAPTNAEANASDEANTQASKERG